MKVFKDGKEVKGASVIYDGGGNAVLVEHEGVQYDASAFELKEAKGKKKTKETPKTVKKQSNSSVLTTEDIK